MKWYIAQAKRDFARFGFTETPLTDEQLTTLYRNNIKLDDAYGIGCDVAAGYGFAESIAMCGLRAQA